VNEVAISTLQMPITAKIPAQEKEEEENVVE
jgi:hypothetical protein